MERQGILFVLSGPSGAGKGTVLRDVLCGQENLAVSVSATTRKPRPGEMDGVHYYFKTKEEFEEMVQNDEFLEHIRKFENRYGTPRAPVERLLEKGVDVILEIETRGAKKVRKMFPKAVLVFITPSTFDELARRLDARGSETEKAKVQRLDMARREYKCITHYDYVAINDDLAQCVATVDSIIRAERSKLKRNPDYAVKFQKQ